MHLTFFTIETYLRRPGIRYWYDYDNNRERLTWDFTLWRTAHSLRNTNPISCYGVSQGWAFLTPPPTKLAPTRHIDNTEQVSRISKPSACFRPLYQHSRNKKREKITPRCCTHAYELIRYTHASNGIMRKTGRGGLQKCGDQKNCAFILQLPN